MICLEIYFKLNQIQQYNILYMNKRTLMPPL